jgi:hypothetical protein
MHFTALHSAQIGMIGTEGLMQKFSCYGKKNQLFHHGFSVLGAALVAHTNQKRLIHILAKLFQNPQGY